MRALAAAGSGSGSSTSRRWNQALEAAAQLAQQAGLAIMAAALTAAATACFLLGARCR
jgi:hypothetical protein